jgi:aminopeptidase 2
VDRTIAELKRRFQPFLEKNDDSLIPPDLQRSIFTIVSDSLCLVSSIPLTSGLDLPLMLLLLQAVRHGGEAEWKKIREVYDSPPTASTKIDALMSLGSTQKSELLEKTFEMLHDGSIKDQDVMYGFVSLSSNRKATRDVSDYFMKRYGEMMKRFGDNFAMNRSVLVLTLSSCFFLVQCVFSRNADS